MPWGAVIGAAVSLYGSSQANKGAKKGIDAQTAASQAAIDEQRREYDQSRLDQMPWMNAGKGALGDMQSLNSGDFSKFHSSPDYQFALDQGMKTLDRSAAARGRLDSGGYGQDLVKYGQGMAEQNYNNFYSRLQSMAGQGQTTATNLGTLGANMATNIGNQYNNMGNARQSGYAQIGQNNAQAAAAIGGAFNYYGQNKGWWG
jgi:hypothetical protein